MSRAYQRQRKKRAKAIRDQTQTDKPKATTADVPKVEDRSAKPTPEQVARGLWHKPTGANRNDKPWVHRSSDMIGRLHAEGQITDSQEQAARTFQEVRAGYLAELGTRGYGSCLADNQQGYDNGEGNAEAIRAYRRIEKSIGGSFCAVLADECDKTGEQRPHMIGLLKAALTAVAERC